MIYFASANFDVCISTSKKKVKRFVKRLRFGGSASFGVVPRQVFSSPEKFQERFGPSLIYDVDQKLKFYPDFSVCSDYSNIFA